MVEKNNNKSKKRISPTGTAAIGALIILIGGFFLSYNYVQSMKIYAYDNMADAIYTEDDNGEAKIVVPEEKKEEEEKGSNEQTETTNYEQERYVGYLSIPKIGFRKGFFAKAEKITVLSSSTSKPELFMTDTRLCKKLRRQRQIIASKMVTNISSMR